MTPTISSSVLFNLDTNQLTYSDNTNYSSFGIGLSSVDGNLKCTGPTGIFYNNTSWVTPSIDLSATNTKLVNLPTSGGNVISGQYTFDYTIRVQSSFSLEGTIHDPPPDPDGVILGGDQTTLFTAGTVFTVTGGPIAGTYSVLSSTYDGGTNQTYVYVNESIEIDTVEGTVTVYNEYTDSQTYSFSNCEPVVSIDFTYDCDCSLITSMDTSNYTVRVNGNYYAPETTSRVHTVYPPVSPSTGNRVAGSQTSSDATIYYSPIWTTDWLSTVQTSLTYDIEGLIVQKTVSGSATLNVECSDALCCASSCLTNLMATYQEFKNDLAHAERWKGKLIEALGYWMTYSVNKGCGNTDEADAALVSLIAVVKASGCACCTTNSAEPVQIVGTCGAASGTGSGANVRVATCGNGITVTPSTVGTTTTYTVCIDIDILNGYIQDYLDTNPIDLSDLGDVLITSLGSGALLRFNGVKWVNVNSISLSQITEMNISSPTVGQIMKWNGSKWVNSANTGDLIAVEQNTYTNVGTSTQTLKTVPLSLGTFAANNDLITVESQWQVSADTNQKQIYLAIDGNDFITSAYLDATGIRRVILNAQIVRMSSTQVRVEYYIKLYGQLANYAFPDYGSTFYLADPTLYTINSMDAASPGNNLQFRCVPTVGGSTISLINYTVKSFKI